MLEIFTNRSVGKNDSWAILKPVDLLSSKKTGGYSSFHQINQWVCIPASSLAATRSSRFSGAAEWVRSIWRETRV